MTPADLKAKRLSLGLSQKQMGEAIGKGQRTIRRWEASKEPLDLRQSTLDKIKSIENGDSNE